MEHLQTVSVNACESLDSGGCDAVVLVAEDIAVLSANFRLLLPALESYQKVVTKFNSGVHVMHCEALPHARLIVSFTGPLDRDYDDVRRISDAAKEGITHAVKSGSTKPLLALATLKTSATLINASFHPKSLCLTALFGALHALYVPLEVREFAAQPHTVDATKSIKANKVEALYWFSGSHYAIDHANLIRIAWCLEEGRRVARDIGGSDPERMCATRVVDYLKVELDDPHLKMTVGPVDPKQYPLAAVVDRGSNDRHRGSIVHLEYSGSMDKKRDPVNLFLVGKGIIYDTGGLDLKTGGTMATMHRDKCGAAAVAGFFKTALLLKPNNLHIYGSLALVRNSIGSNAYASDEIVVSRAGVRVRVNNTDAEGRMVMTDLLCEAKERAVLVQNPQLMTFATLTGHVVMCYGNNYTGVLCNGPARNLKADHMFQEAGALLGEVHEISTIRREDYEAHDAAEEYADLVNHARPAGGKRVRGHQSAAAFMIRASGLDTHMCNSKTPLPYTHFDIAGSQGPCPGIPTAVPLLTLASRFILNDYWTDPMEVLS